ncbi:unnamed protein product [Oppiella nova]|uniref:Uncharacterized protein n=1 Tax=Oppiella nova TaxID=334625 RepID=A0A7R9LW98_9ACAR|nr:unnamed protein product [Oppiella nova]CAG2167527.1 unnamed protein product [Oppiella nova]
MTINLCDNRMQNGNFITNTDNTPTDNNDNAIITRSPKHCWFPDDQQMAANMERLERNTFKVFLTNGNYNVVKTGDVTDVRGIIALITSRLSSDSSKRFYESAYAIRIARIGGTSDDHFWLHPETSMNEALDHHQNLLDADWRYELRIRYIPSTLSDILVKDRFTFHYLYDQIEAPVDQDLAIQLCCLEIKFFDLVQPFVNFKEEKFKCALGTGWSIPVQLVIGCDFGIGYVTDRTGPPTQMAQFQSVQSIHITTNVNENNANNSAANPLNQSNKSVLQLKIAGASEVLAISCPSNTIAENIANLIDGYCRLVNNTDDSFWIRKALF